MGNRELVEEAKAHQRLNHDHMWTFVSDPESAAVLSLACSCGTEWVFDLPFEWVEE